MPPNREQTPFSNRISHGMPSRLLVLSNGHGEDLIALRLIEALAARSPGVAVRVLPLVGEGDAFAAAEGQGVLERIGPRLRLPSGGFSNQSATGLLADLRAGLAGLSWRQGRLVRAWGRQAAPVLAVGDSLPLLLAWASGAPYGFVGTPKSDQTWASPPPPGWGRTPLADTYHRCKGSEWDPWEWALMGCRRCRLVAVRDRLTARGLRRRGVEALAPGNPMMDGGSSDPLPAALAGRRRVLLLAGSRMPEAARNFGRLLEALSGSGHGPAGLTVLAPTGSRPSPADLAPLLAQRGFRPIPPAAGSGASAAWRRDDLDLLLGPGRFERWAGWAEVGLANAGTATEQLVGRGVAALSLPGRGPQFTTAFARRQSRLLGGAVLPCHDPAEMGARLRSLLTDGALRERLGRIGRRRMGSAGGSARLASLIDARLLGAGSG
jgi:uncharacterized protein (TIGR03492 family)